MPALDDPIKVKRYLGEVMYRKEYAAVEGLEPLRRLLEKDENGGVLQILLLELPGLSSHVKGAIAFLISQRLCQRGDAPNLKKLYFEGDDWSREGTLNGLAGSLNNPQMGSVVLDLTMHGFGDASAMVRYWACNIVQNICAEVDASPALNGIKARLRDQNGFVRMGAACAVGNLARSKRRYDVCDFVAPLKENLMHCDVAAREWSAWALWQVSRRCDIRDAVEDLFWLLAQPGVDLKNARKNAAGALLHYARRSTANGEEVRKMGARIRGEETKEAGKFLNEISVSAADRVLRKDDR